MSRRVAGLHGGHLGPEGYGEDDAHGRPAADPIDDEDDEDSVVATVAQDAHAMLWLDYLP